MTLRRSTCGKSRHKLTSPHLDSGTYILEHAEHFWPPYPYADLMVQFTTVSEEQNKQKIVQVIFDEQREIGKNNKKNLAH